MAYLLGAAAVMESLQRDVRDVQSCVADIISRVGPVHFTSWKFPDKVACDLDIEDLLDLYSYSDEEEERQVAHIALYELVIDRLVLLLHMMATYTEGLFRTAHVEAELCKTSGTSVGVVATKYWNRLSQLQQVLKQAVIEKNTMHRKVGEMEDDMRRLNGELKQARDTGGGNTAGNRPKTAGVGGMGGLIPPNRAELITGMSFDPSQLKKFGLISKDEYNKSCQTNETAFTPCDSCSVVQKSFRQTGEITVAICQQQQIPSCLQKFRPQVSHLDWLSGNDVVRWATEQNKDLQRISKLTATIKPLKDELSDTHKRKDKLENRVLNFDRDLKKEKDERSIMHRQYETKIKEMDAQHTQTLELEKQQRELLEQNKSELEKLVGQHRLELNGHQSLLQSLEFTKSRLENELSSTKVDTAEVQRLEREMTGLQSQLGDISTKMETSAKELQKEQAKYKNAAKNNQSLQLQQQSLLGRIDALDQENRDLQDQSLQLKQQSLLGRIDALDQENRDLQDQVAELEEEKEKFEDNVNDGRRETTQLERKLREKQSEIEQVQADKESLEQTISTLETSMAGLTEKLEEAKERERLIVEYPDINGPVNPDLTGTGDILQDMENQVKANNIRIQLLESQNEGLRNSVGKLVQMQQQNHQLQHQPYQPDVDDDGGRWATHVQQSQPQPLWNQAHLQHQPDNRQCLAPEYASMESKYHQSGLYNRNYSNQSENPEKPPHYHKPGAQSGIQNIQFDDKATTKSSKPSSATKERQQFGHRPLTGSSAKTSGSEFLVGKAVRPESAKVKHDSRSPQGKGRPQSGRPQSGKSIKNVAAQQTSAIGAYLQLKKAGKLGTDSNYNGATTSNPSALFSRPTSGKTRVPTADVDLDSNYSRRDNFMCSACDKMYTRERDLEIHMSYCTG